MLKSKLTIEKITRKIKKQLYSVYEKHGKVYISKNYMDITIMYQITN